MKIIVDESTFVRTFDDYGRGNNFSVAAREALFEYLDEADPDMELDVIGICCEFSEHDSALDAAKEYGFEADEGEDESEQEASAQDWLTDRTIILECRGGSVVISGF